MPSEGGGSAAVPVELIQNRQSLFCDLFFLIWLWMESSAGDSNPRLPPYRVFSPLNRLLPSSLPGVHAGRMMLTDGEGGGQEGLRVGGGFKGFHPTHTPVHTCPHLAASSPLWNELLGIKEQGGLTGGPQGSGLGLGGPREDWGGPWEDWIIAEQTALG